MDKSGTIHERITQLVDTFGKGKNTVFASLIGSNEANVRGYKTSVMPKFDFLEKIARSLDIDLKWLLTGEGSMLHEAAQSSSEPFSASFDAVALRLMDKLDDKEAENKQLQVELRAKSEELAILKAQRSQTIPNLELHPDSSEGLGHAKCVSSKNHSSPTADDATSAIVP